ncbi:hypothetical protein LA304_12010 [Celeribacter sp. ASW11-22]|nr:hypothetical protein [Celeribacter litoreus]
MRHWPSFGRLLRGGSLQDLGRLPRYLLLFLAGLAGIWAPILLYLSSTPPSYTSYMSLILPGSGASSSVNLADIGQASTHANSAFANNSVSPTETYKRLLAADRIVMEAARHLDLDRHAFGRPQVQLVDQTAFIHVNLSGPSPEAARDRTRALLAAFMAEIDRLRLDEQDTRQTGGLDAIHDYRASVSRTREDIAALRESSGLHSSEQYQRYLKEAEALEARVSTLRADHARTESTVRELEGRLGVDSRTAAHILKLNSDEIYVALLQATATATSDLATAQASYGPSHPIVQTAKSARSLAEERLQARAQDLIGADVPMEQSVDGGRGVLLSELVRKETEEKGLATELRALEAQLSTERARLANLAPHAARLEDLQRDFDVAEAVFASAIARTQSQRTDIYASYPLVQVLEDPTLPDAPSSPSKKLSIAAGIAGSFLLMVALVMGWVRNAVITILVRRGDDDTANAT